MIFEIENEDRKRKKEERGGDSYGSDDCGEGEWEEKEKSDEYCCRGCHLCEDGGDAVVRGVDK